MPLRTCIACQQKRPKRELVRVVRRPEGAIEIDPKGKLAGRGAYLCLDWACFEDALQQKKLARALKCPVDAGQVASLRAEVEALLSARAQPSE